MFGLLYFVFSVYMRFSTIEHYPVYLLSGILLCNYFADATSAGLNSLLVKSSLLTKVTFPRLIIPLSALVTSTITLVTNIVVLLFFILLTGV